MTLYTADTPREWREKGGSLSKKLNTEFGLLGTLLDSVSRTTNTLTITKATITLAGSTKINLDGPVDISGAIVCDAAAGIGISLTSNYTDAIKISGTTIADGIEISAACGTAGINISGAQAVGVSINTSTPVDGILISSACADAIHISGISTANAINISGAQATGNAIAITSTGTLSGHLKGIAIDYDGVTLGTQSNTGIEVLMHATYGDTGTEYAIYASGDGTTVALCSDDKAAITVGGTVTTGLNLGGTLTTGITIGSCTNAIGATIASTGSSVLTPINIVWASDATYGTGDRIRGTGGMSACLNIGNAATASEITGAGDHLAIYTNMNVNVAITSDTTVMGGGYHVVTLSSVPTQHMGIIAPVTGYARNTVVCTGSTEFIATRGVIYTASDAESISQTAGEFAIIDQTGTRATTADIKGVLINLNIANNSVGGGKFVHLQLEEEGSVNATAGILYSTGTYDIGIDFQNQCTTAIDIGNTTTGIVFTGTAGTTGINFGAAIVTELMRGTISTSGASIRPILDFMWTTTTTIGADADPIMGSQSWNVEGFMQIGDTTTPAVINGVGSHVGLMINLNMTAANQTTNTINGGVYVIQQYGAAQNVTTALTVPFTAYIKNATGTQTVDTKNICYRAAIYTDANNETNSQTLFEGTIRDLTTTRNGVEGITGMALQFDILDRGSGGVMEAFLIQAGTDVTPNGMDQVFRIPDDNWTYFAYFSADGTCAGKPAHSTDVGTATSIDADDVTGYIKVKIDAVDRYIYLFDDKASAKYV